MKSTTHLSVLLLTWLTVPLAVCGQAPAANPAPAQSPPRTEPDGFQFEGGTIRDFLTKLRERYGTNVTDLIDVSGEAANNLRVPKMRIPKAQDIRQVLFVYNQVSSQGDGFLGKWCYPQGIPVSQSGELPTMLIFMPPKPAADTGGVKVRAFSIRGITDDEVEELHKTIEVESERLRAEVERGTYGAQDPSVAVGRLSVHKGTWLLVATGGKTYVELAAAVIDAFMTTRRTLGSR